MVNLEMVYYCFTNINLGIHAAMDQWPIPRSGSQDSLDQIGLVEGNIDRKAQPIWCGKPSQFRWRSSQTVVLSPLFFRWTHPFCRCLVPKKCCLLQVQGAIATGIAGAPLRGKDGHRFQGLRDLEDFPTLGPYGWVEGKNHQRKAHRNIDSYRFFTPFPTEFLVCSVPSVVSRVGSHYPIADGKNHAFL